MIDVGGQSARVIDFNTKKVRLKPTHRYGHGHYPLQFQYQKGAIKTGFAVTEACRIVLFQYQKGAIKTGSGRLQGVLVRKFQYQKGAIKTIARNQIILRIAEFQYQKGAIKTSCPAGKDVPAPHFNTKKVRLKRTAIQPSIPMSSISIPKRCD